MKIDQAIKRMEYYVRWFNDLSPAEKESFQLMKNGEKFFIGEWVRERIDLFYQAIIHEMNHKKAA